MIYVFQKSITLNGGYLNGNYVHYTEKTFVCFYITHTISFIRNDKKSETGVAFPVLPEAAFVA